MGAPSRWSCPSEDALFRFSTGDASRWQRARLRCHVDRCGECAAQLQAWEAATAAYRDYVQGPPVQGRLDAEARVSVARFDARVRREPLSKPTPLAWSRQTLRPLGWRSLAAAVVLVAGGLFGFLPIQETITADALVARAVANDRQCPCPPADMVTIAARPHRGDSRVVATGASTTSASRGLISERGAHARELAERLADYAFDWRVPLSARPYQEWRSATTARTESYDWIASDRVRVSTHAASGRIERAELILRTPDYRPVGQTWLFADGFAVELRLSERDAHAAPPAVTSPTLSRVAAADASAASVAPVDRTIEETEIALRVSLERAGVVMTRRLALRHNGERLTIAGRAASRDVRRIAASAREIGGVTMEVRAEASRTANSAGAPDAPDASGRGASSGVSTGFDAWLDRTFGDGRSRAAFLPRAQALSDSFADAVAALDGLSRRFPVSTVDARLSTRARGDVRWLIAAYYARVVASYERLEAHLAPLTGSVSRRILSTTPPSHWRTAASSIAPAIRALSAELGVLSSSPSSTATSSSSAAADAFERTAGGQLRERLAAVVPR
jgi:hypothetical protein